MGAEAADVGVVVLAGTKTGCCGCGCGGCCGCCCCCCCCCPVDRQGAGPLVSQSVAQARVRALLRSTSATPLSGTENGMWAVNTLSVVACLKP